LNTKNEQDLLNAIKIILNAPDELINCLSYTDKQQILNKINNYNDTCDICGTKISKRDNTQNFGLCNKCLRDNNSK